MQLCLGRDTLVQTPELAADEHVSTEKNSLHDNDAMCMPRGRCVRFDGRDTILVRYFQLAVPASVWSPTVAAYSL